MNKKCTIEELAKIDEKPNHIKGWIYPEAVFDSIRTVADKNYQPMADELPGLPFKRKD